MRKLKLVTPKQESKTPETSKHRNRNLKTRNEKSLKTINERDAKIIEYCSEMKFAPYKVLRERFFQTTFSGEHSRSDLWARERLKDLVDDGYLNSNHTPLASTRYYSATTKGYHLVQMMFPHQIITRPIQGFDLRTFVHDKELVLIRQELESQGEITDWISDRRLRMGLSCEHAFTTEFVPDAIVKRIDGTHEAIELEIATKARSRYIAKIRFYLDLIRESETDTFAIQAVNFICLRKSVFKILEEECRPYSGVFKVTLRGEVIEKADLT